VERQIRDLDRDAEMTASSEKLLNTLRLLLERRAMRTVINQVLASEQGKSGEWVYPPLSKVKLEGSEEEEGDDGSPMKKAERKHFRISEPGTGPVLNHPLSTIIDTGLDRDTVIEALINELTSTVK
jgi:hypothetical protein